MRLALYLLCAPWDLTILGLSWLLIPLGVHGVRRAYGVLWLDIGEGSLLHRRWRYSTTIGHLVLLQPGLAGSSVEQHELVHVRQYEGAVCAVWLAALAALLLRGWLGSASLLPVLILGPWWSYAGASLAALLRGQRGYLDNHFERHARAEVLVASVAGPRSRSEADASTRRSSDHPLG
jgi:hypothetical protein